MRRFRWTRRGTRSQRGFSIIDLIIAVGVSAFVIMAGMAFYAGTLRSARGTSSLAGLQRDAALAVESVSRAIREGSSVTIASDSAAGSDSLRVLLRVGTVDSLIACYHPDDQGQLLDISGNIVVSNVDSVQFSTSNGTLVNASVYLRDGMGTAESSDDQSVLIETTTSCRNY